MLSEPKKFRKSFDLFNAFNSFLDFIKFLISLAIYSAGIWFICSVSPFLPDLTFVDCTSTLVVIQFIVSFLKNTLFDKN